MVFQCFQYKAFQYMAYVAGNPLRWWLKEHAVLSSLLKVDAKNRKGYMKYVVVMEIDCVWAKKNVDLTAMLFSQ